jgi:hypothetical protein
MNYKTRALVGIGVGVIGALAGAIVLIRDASTPKVSPAIRSAQLGPTQPTPEQTLAMLDGKKQAGAERPYARLLDLAESKCYEKREEIARLNNTMVQVARDRGTNSDNLSMLTELWNVIKDGPEDQDCIELYTAIATIMPPEKK